jgi:hypothetical protein
LPFLKKFFFNPLFLIYFTSYFYTFNSLFPSSYTSYIKLHILSLFFF